LYGIGSGEESVIADHYNHNTNITALNVSGKIFTRRIEDKMHRMRINKVQARLMKIEFVNGDM
jgi:hypothetical protein